MIVPGGGISLDGTRWVSCRPGFFLPVRVLSKLFRRLFPAKLTDAYTAGRLRFFGDHVGLGDNCAFAAFLAPLKKKNWFAYTKPRSPDPRRCWLILPGAVYSTRRHFHSPSIALTEAGGTFRVKAYRRSGEERYRTMTLEPADFIRRFRLRVLPKGFHRNRHYGLLASAPPRPTSRALASFSPRP
ncbi:transposase [Mesorhizobium sp.]|uniref:transposase n=1 Tax=Mesorhizobium sp. TaxID=1871066 RepID=UPI0025BABBFA|nr:transposase [Mesorhizobium sp.]